MLEYDKNVRWMMEADSLPLSELGGCGNLPVAQSLHVSELVAFVAVEYLPVVRDPSGKVRSWPRNGHVGRDAEKA